MDYKLGKLPPKIDKRTIPLKAVIRRELLPPLPETYNIDEALGGIEDERMFNNSKYGDCVIAARAHQTFRFEKYEQGEQIDITDEEVVDEYFEQTGGEDRGLVLLLSLNDWRSDGWSVGGKDYTIYAYGKVDQLDPEEVRHCIHLLGGLNLGMRVYQADIDQFNNGEDWHLTGNPGNYLGGHGIYVYAYDDNGVTCMTWGKRQKMTWEFFTNRVDEAYGIVDNRNKWMGEESPVDVEKLDGYLSQITEGNEQPGCAFWPVVLIKKCTMKILERFYSRYG